MEGLAEAEEGAHRHEVAVRPSLNAAAVQGGVPKMQRVGHEGQRRHHQRQLGVVDGVTGLLNECQGQRRRQPRRGGPTCPCGLRRLPHLPRRPPARPPSWPRRSPSPRSRRTLAHARRVSGMRTGASLETRGRPPITPMRAVTLMEHWVTRHSVRRVGLQPLLAWRGRGGSQTPPSRPCLRGRMIADYLVIVVIGRSRAWKSRRRITTTRFQLATSLRPGTLTSGRVQ